MRTSLRRLGTATALLATVGLGATACGSSSDGQDPAPSGPPPASSGAASPAALAQGLNPDEGTAGTAGTADTAPKQSTAPQPASGLVLRAIRVGEHEGRDRVVFEFTGSGEPAYTVDYVDSPAQQGSGKPLTVPGDAFLQVGVEGQTIPTDGATEVPVGTVTAEDVAGVGGVAFAGQFEGRAQAVIGVEGGRRAFTAFTLQNPTRLVVDISR